MTANGIDRVAAELEFAAGAGGVYAWEVLDHGRDSVVATRGTARVTDPLMALDLALAGVGIAYQFEPRGCARRRAGL